MWSVAYTDIFQLSIVAIGLAVALPFVLSGAGGLHHAWATYIAARPEGGGIMPPWQPHTALWSRGSVISWWDTSVMLMLGGIPWNCYFQRVLSCRSPRAAQGQSMLSGVLTIAFTIPPLLKSSPPRAGRNRIAAQRLPKRASKGSISVVKP